MKSEPLSPAVRSLIGERIDSVGELELLLFLYSHAGQDWTPSRIAAELRTAEPVADVQLHTLAQRGLTARTDAGYRYHAEGDLHQAVAELARAYAAYPVAVVTLIYTKPNRAVKSFAEAFRLRNKPPRDPGGPPHG